MYEGQHKAEILSYGWGEYKQRIELL